MWVAYYAMKPAAEIAQDATDAEKHRIVAWFRLLLAILLFILFAGLVLTFRRSAAMSASATITDRR